MTQVYTMKLPGIIKTPLVWGLIMLLIGLVSLKIYFENRTPEGIETMGDQDVTIVWLSLTTSIVSLLTAMTGLIKTIVDARKKES